MFSKRSVRVHPSAPPIEYGGTPEDLIVAASFVRSGHVLGALTPASEKEWTLYQTVDLLLALKTRPYALFFTTPSASQEGEKFLTMTGRANSMGFSAP